MPREAEIKATIAQVMHRNAHRPTHLPHCHPVGADPVRDPQRPNRGQNPLPHPTPARRWVENAPLAPQSGNAIEDQLDDLPTLCRIDWVDFSRASPRFRQQAMQQVEIIHG